MSAKRSVCYRLLGLSMEGSGPSLGGRSVSLPVGVSPLACSYPGDIMVWRCFVNNRPGLLVLIECKINAGGYISYPYNLPREAIAIAAAAAIINYLFLSQILTFFKKTMLQFKKVAKRKDNIVFVARTESRSQSNRACLGQIRERNS